VHPEGAAFPSYAASAGGAGSTSARRLEQALASVLRARPLVSTNRRFVFFDLRPFAARLRRALTHNELVALRAATLTPPRVEARGGVWPGEELNASLHGSWWFTSRRATLDLYEPGRGETVVFRGTFANQLGPGIVRRGLPRVWATWPGGARSVLLANARGVQFAHRLHLRHGDNLLRIRTNALQIFAPWDSRTLYLQLVDARFDEPAFALLEGARTAGLRGDAP
jgi:hypothetical protein